MFEYKILTLRVAQRCSKMLKRVDRSEALLTANK